MHSSAWAEFWELVRISEVCCLGVRNLLLMHCSFKPRCSGQSDQAFHMAPFPAESRSEHVGLSSLSRYSDSWENCHPGRGCHRHSPVSDVQSLSHGLQAQGGEKPQWLVAQLRGVVGRGVRADCESASLRPWVGTLAWWKGLAGLISQALVWSRVSQC